MNNIFKKIFYFYRDGIKEMRFGRKLWFLIIIKLIIMFAILRVFFFKPYLSKYKTQEEKSENVIQNLKLE